MSQFISGYIPFVPLLVPPFLLPQVLLQRFSYVHGNIIFFATNTCVLRFAKRSPTWMIEMWMQLVKDSARLFGP
jgi:hypothetical protein